MQEFKIKTIKGERTIGGNNPAFIIAELSGNHHHNFDNAIKLIDAATEAGVDAVKLQTYTPDTITLNCDKDPFQIKVNDAWKGQTLHSLYEKCYTPWEWQPKLKEYGESKGLVVFSTPFDNTAVDFLEEMNVALYKVASFEVVDIPLLKRIGQTKKPVIMSRGMASIEEIDLAIRTLKENGAPAVAILHCINSYPTIPEEMNIVTIPDLRDRFGVVAGLSDHSLGITASVASVALGGKIIEKHIIMSRDEGGPDAGFSLDPKEFKELVKTVRETEKAIGKPSYGYEKKEKENVIFRKSLWVAKDIKKGEKFSPENVRSVRPGHGLAPKYYDEIIGKIAKNNVEFGEPLRWDMIKDNSYNTRDVKREDSKRVWEIRNHPIARQYSGSSEEIPFENHDPWFEKKYFVCEENYCFIMEDSNNYVIGYCRFDFDDENDNYIISIAVDPDCQGKGLGHKLLSESLEKFNIEKDILAEISKINIASIKLFEKSNFKEHKEDEENYYLKYNF